MENNTKTILIVDDEKNIVDILSFNLQHEGFSILVAYDGKEGLRLAKEKNPDLILLDVMLPYMDGFEVCRNIRDTNKLVPIIMLTAREEESDKVFGLELGADDYIVKPFSVRELIARVRTNLRRSTGFSLPRESEENLVRVGKLAVDEDKMAVFKNDVEVEVSPREFDLIKTLLSQPGKVFSREYLMTEVWKYEFYGDVRAVDVAIRRLREKIEDNPAEPQYIMTKRGAGYYFAAESR